MEKLITASIIKDSINERGTRITTFELDYPRIIHSEFMTHREFSRNSASSRAIPVDKVIEMIEQNPAMPVHWGKNQAGMQAKEELSELDRSAVRQLWIESAKHAVAIARAMQQHAAHKQVINRILEPFQWMKVVMTTTNCNNWFWLRKHADADPTIKALADEMYKEYTDSIPTMLYPGDWHLPYIQTQFDDNDTIQYLVDDKVVDLQTAIKVSASCCAQTSYRKQDTSTEKAENIFDRLINSEPMHASPVEHQAMCFDDRYYWPHGVTHRDKQGTYYSGNFKDWIQYRQLLNNNAKGSWTI